MRDDIIIPFEVGGGAVRGRIVRLGAAIDDVLRPHEFSDSVSELLGEAATLTALMGASLKFDGKLIFQAQGEGVVKLLVADYVSDGAIRATAARPSFPTWRTAGTSPRTARPTPSCCARTCSSMTARNSRRTT